MSVKAMPLFEVKNLKWSIDGVSILSDLNFEIKEKEFIGIIGPNGSGKSSLISCLYRKNKATQGLLKLNQKPIELYSRLELARQLAVMHQDPLPELSLQFELSVSDIIGMGLIPHKSLFTFEHGKDQDKIKRAATQVNLLDKIAHSFHTLSGGEKQRVMIARAIVQAPQCLLLDEPTNHLDIRHQIDILQLLKSLNTTIVMSIHDLNLAASYCDRIILLNQGKIIAQGLPEKVLTKELLEEVFEVPMAIDQQPSNARPRISYALNV